MANKLYWATGRTGGTDSLDGIDGAGLVAGDAAVVVMDLGASTPAHYLYRLYTSSAAESDPDVIAPDANAGTGRWHLITIEGAGFLSLAGGAMTGPITSLRAKGVAAVTSFAGTAARSGYNLTFSSAADAILAGYHATQPVLGTTVVLSANTMVILSWTNSTVAVVDQTGTIGSATPTSVQAPVAFGLTSAGVLTWAMLPSGILHTTAYPTVNGVVVFDQDVSADGNPSFSTINVVGTNSLNLGTAGSLVGQVTFKNATSGAITVSPPTGALGALAIVLPSASGILPTVDSEGNLFISSLLGAELITAPMVTGGWTLGYDTGGWAIADGVLSKTASTATLTATSVTGMTVAPIAGKKYKVTIISSAASGSTGWSLGGVTGTAITAAGTTIAYITANTTAKLLFQSGAAVTVSITSVSVRDMTETFQADLAATGKTDSVNTTSSTVLASATAVKTAKDAADLKIPLAGGTLSGPLSLGPSYLSTTKVVGATGTTANYLCTIEAATGKVNTPPVSAVGVLGIAVTTRAGGSDLSLEVMTRGIGSIIMDTGSTSVIGNLALVGTTVAGTAKDAGFADSTSIDGNVQILGKFLSVASPGNAASIQFYGPGHYGAKAALIAVAALPAHYERDQLWQQKGVSVTEDRYTIQTPNRLTVNINNVGYLLTAMANLDLSTSGSWDTTAGTDYTQSTNRAGVDFFIYACTPVSGTSPTFKLSANSTVPSGYDANTSRKIGGFHCICGSVGTISGHLLTGFVYGDILPASIWDLKWKPRCLNPSGMAYDAKSCLWVDIYLASGTDTSTASVNGGTISDTRTWLDFVDDGGAVGKRLLRDHEFQLAATNGNEETNIYGSQDPVTAGKCAPKLFTGAGLNDLTVNRTAFDVTVGAQEYEVEIDGTGTPDTFKWKKRTFGGSYGASTGTVGITGSAQTLADGVTITFAATIGHTVGNKWNLYVMDGLRDTANRRMISNIGCEGMAGVLWQWLLDQSYMYDIGIPTVSAAVQVCAVTGTTGEGSLVYIKFGNDGTPYLCSPLATAAVDKVLTFGTNYKIVLKYDAAAATGGLQVNFNVAGTAPFRLECTNAPYAKDVFVFSNDPAFMLPIKYVASPGGANLYFDDSASGHNRLESTQATGNIDLGTSGPAWAYADLPGVKGSLYRQGTYGDVKLLAGATWSGGTDSGARARYASSYRWYTLSRLGGRFASEPG